MEICVFSTSNLAEAGMIIGALEENGINNFSQNSNFAGLYPGAFEKKIFVKDEDAEKAKEIIQSLFTGT